MLWKSQSRLHRHKPFQSYQAHTFATAILKSYDPLYFTRVAILFTSLLALKLTPSACVRYFTQDKYPFLHRSPCSATANKISSQFTSCYCHHYRRCRICISNGSCIWYYRLYSVYMWDLGLRVLSLSRPPRARKFLVTNIQLVYLNAVVNIPAFLLTVFFSRPLARQFLQPIITKPTLFLLFRASCILSTVINHTIFLNSIGKNPISIDQEQYAISTTNVLRIMGILDCNVI